MTNSILFDERYALRFQDILSKVAVGKAISNMRLEKIASFGQQIDRYKLDLSGIRVRDEVRTQTDRTADDVSMSKQYLTVNNGKYMGFHLHKWDIKQLGPHKLQLEDRKSVV